MNRARDSRRLVSAILAVACWLGIVSLPPPAAADDPPNAVGEVRPEADAQAAAVDAAEVPESKEVSAPHDGASTAAQIDSAADAPIGQAPTAGPDAASAEGETASVAEDVASESPADVVEHLHTALLQVMRKSDVLGFQGRYDHLRPVLIQSFDLQFMGSKAAGRHWRDFDQPHQEELIEAFRRFMTANYAGRFNGYSGESFETLGRQEAALDTVIVLTELRLPDDDPVQLNYRLRQTENGWRIIDIYLHGTVSELALRRAEYGTVLERDGIAGLIGDLNDRVVAFASDTDN